MSSIGPKVQRLGLRFMVGAFHGHAHNRLCQLDWHPMYIEGTGNTEGEGCEHVFSVSNELARGIRHAMRFHRHQAIEEHFAFWNADKYEALSTYCPLNYSLLTCLYSSAFYSEPLSRSNRVGSPTRWQTYRYQNRSKSY